MAQEESNWNDCIQHAVISDVGMRRTGNEDAFAVLPAINQQSWYERGHLFLVADGTGAHAGGQVASKLAAHQIPHVYYIHRDKTPPEAILSAISESNALIHQRGTASTDFRNMGTTASVLLLLPQGALVAHVGDSRVYRLRNHQLEQLTFDHSLVWEMRASGKLPKSHDLAAVVPSNVITRSLGPNVSVEIDLEGPWPIELGDTFLLCSDGLSGKVENDEMGALLGTLEPNEAAQIMVDLANLRGGPDNITAIVIKITGSELTTAAARPGAMEANANRSKSSVHPSIWAILGICLLAGGVMLSANYIFPSIFAFAGGAVAALVAFLQKIGVFTPEQSEFAKGRMRWGKGPYTQTACPANTEFAVRLQHLSNELKSAAFNGKWNIDFSPIDSYAQRATKAISVQNHNEAIRQFARGISDVMTQLRRRRTTEKNDKTTSDFP